MKVFAPAKVNLGLRVLGTRADGFHALDSVVALLGFGDDVELEPAETTTLEMVDDGVGLGALPTDIERNLAVRAVRLLEREVGRPLPTRIRIVKRIPLGDRPRRNRRAPPDGWRPAPLARPRQRWLPLPHTASLQGLGCRLASQARRTENGERRTERPCGATGGAAFQSANQRISESAACGSTRNARDGHVSEARRAER